METNNMFSNMHIILPYNMIFSRNISLILTQDPSHSWILLVISKYDFEGMLKKDVN